MTSLPFPGTPQSRRETLSFILIGENGARLDRPNPSIMEQMESSIESIGFSLASSSSLLILHPRSTPICNTVRNSNCSDRGRERERERLDRFASIGKNSRLVIVFPTSESRSRNSFRELGGIFHRDRDGRREEDSPRNWGEEAGGDEKAKVSKSVVGRDHAYVIDGRN